MIKKQFNKKYAGHTRRGVIVLTMMIVVGAIITVIALLLLYTSTNTNQIRFYQSYSEKLFFNADACAEEALARLDRNNNYTGGTLTLDISTCTITVTGSGSTRTIQVNVTSNNDSVLQLNMVRTLQINATIFPNFTVTSWQELTT